MKEPETIQVNTLSDDPTGDDAFGSHKKIAEAIKNMVETEKGGKAIALEGTWGSGKSTVVKILSDLCEEERTTKQGTLVFTFDSWAHRGDPLRRSFFEKAVEKLDAAGWTKKTRWEDSIDLLAGRGKETTTTQARMNTMGLVYSIAIALAPIGLVILNKQTSAIELELTPGLVLSALPAVLVGMATITWIIAYIIGFFGSNRKESILRFLSPVNSKVDSKVVTSTVRTNDPTSIEFRIEFQELLERTLKAKKRKLVIVVDNLDRVGDETALSIWSNLRTFFHFDDPNSLGWGDRVWLIVPFSQAGISELWDNTKNKDATAKSFEAKTFQVSFRVPQPVLSDWVAYFKSQLDAAFEPGLEKPEAEAVYWIYRQLVYPSVASPTPRKIKTFINRIGSLMRCRGTEILPRILALYAALETQKDFETKLTSLEPKLLGSISPDMVGQDHMVELIALHYGVNVSRARQLLLRKPLEKAIESGNPDDLRGSQGIQGFTICCEEYVDKLVQHQTAPGNAHVVAYTASVFAQLEIDENEHWWHMWRLLRDAALSVESWETFDETAGDGLARLIERNKGMDLGGKFLESISNSDSLFEDSDGEQGEVATGKALCGISNVIKALIREGDQSIGLILSVPATTYRQVMRIWVGNPEISELAKYCHSSIEVDEVVAVFEGAIRDGKFDDSDEKVLKVLHDHEPAYPLDKLIPDIENRLQAGVNVTAPELGPLLHMLLDHQSVEPAFKVMFRLATLDHILSHLGRLHKSLSAQTIATIVRVMLEHNPDGKAVAGAPHAEPGAQVYIGILGNPEEHAEILDHVYGKLTQHANQALLLKVIKREGKTEDFGDAIVRRLIDEPKLNEIIPAQVFLDNETSFYNSLSGEEKKYGQLVSRFVKETDLLDLIVEASFEPSLATLYIPVNRQTHESQRDRISAFLVNGLRALSGEVWTENIDTEYASVLDLVSALTDDGVDLELGLEYEKGLRAMIDGGDSVDSEAEPDSRRLLALLPALKTSLRNTLLREYLDKIISPPQDVPVDRLVSLFTPELISCKLLEDKADDLVRAVLRRILDSQSGKELDWLHQTLLNCPNVAKKCRMETSSAYQEKIRHFLSDENELSDEFQTKLDKISKLLGAASS